MSEQPAKPSISNARTLLFMVVLSFICSVILSLLASMLHHPKVRAKELDRSKQMMIAAKLLDHSGHFLIKNDQGNPVPAKYEKNGLLVEGSPHDHASEKEILEIYNRRLKPLLTNDKGELVTFQEAKINEEDYIKDFRKTGYYKQPYKLLYKVLPNKSAENAKDEVEGWVFPINGLGLWDAIYGYLAIKPDAMTVIGITWYDQKETPGLGANIADAPWQALFPGKKIFQENSSGQIDFKTAPIGVNVVRGKVSEVYGDSPKSKSAVDGMAGATLTGNGVTDAYRDVLTEYRPLLMRIQAEQKNGKQEEQKVDK